MIVTLSVAVYFGVKIIVVIIKHSNLTVMFKMEIRVDAYS